MDHDYIQRHQVIEEYVMGRLPPAEAARFEDHYLTCEECIRRLDLAEKFQSGFRDVVAEDLAAPVGLAAVFAAVARRRWAAAGGALALALLVALGVLSWRVLRLDRELDEANARLTRAESRQAEGGRQAAAAQQEAGALRQRLAAEEQARNRLAEELARANRPRAGAAWVVALVPARSGPAAGEPFQRITLPPSPEWIVLSLDLDLPSPGPYRVSLRRRDGLAIWTGEKLSPGPTGTLAVGLDSALLTPGDYRLLVEQGSFPVARFAFRVGR
ncbi:MAG TPA: zf-HC2 domain-containing protein [Thermoanaerobaculia bacterium]|nr:zf-HC2 domain-containing protein [Thermoanaerobaculia bacterium]